MIYYGIKLRFNFLVYYGVKISGKNPQKLNSDKPVPVLSKMSDSKPERIEIIYMAKKARIMRDINKLKMTARSMSEQWRNAIHDDDGFCVEHEQTLWKDGNKCGGCLEADDRRKALRECNNAKWKAEKERRTDAEKEWFKEQTERTLARQPGYKNEGKQKKKKAEPEIDTAQIELLRAEMEKTLKECSEILNEIRWKSETIAQSLSIIYDSEEEDDE